MMKTKKFLVLLFVTILMLTSAFSCVNAVDLTPTSGSLTIKKYETGNKNAEGNQEKLPLAGVTFRIYKVEDDSESLVTPTEAPTAEATTDTNGEAKFENLDLGRYLVVEYDKPANVVDVVPNFLVDIPMTISNGSDVDYNPTVEVKNNTAYGTITLKKVNEAGEALAGVTFILQKKNGTSWETYEIYDGENLKVLTTDENGEIVVDGLPVGDYRFIETSTLAGYILDNKTAYEFNVSTGEISSEGTSSTIVSPSQITVTNEKPTIAKEITSISRDAKDNNGIKDGNNSADIGDIVSYKVTVDVPSMIDRLNTFKVSDTMSTGLTLQNNEIVVTGIKADSSTVVLAKDTDYTVTEDAHNWEIVCTNENLKDYKSLEITYSAKINSDAIATSAGNTNKATLEYSSIVKTDYEDKDNTETKETPETPDTKVYTGGLKIEKRAITRDGELLSGAEFKLADSIDNARKGIYMTDAEGNQITLTTTNGVASYKGLSYGKYYLVEVKAPSYEESGETKYYNLLKDPVEITIGADTFEGAANIIINKKGTLLPMTGGMGTLLITVAGIVLVVIGIVYLRKNKEESSVKEQNK